MARILQATSDSRDLRMPRSCGCISTSAALAVGIFFTQNHHVRAAGFTSDNAEVEAAAQRANTFRVLRELYDASEHLQLLHANFCHEAIHAKFAIHKLMLMLVPGIAAGGEQWLVPSGGKKWNFTTQAFGTDDYCTWHGVVCCTTDEDALHAIQDGAVFSAGRSAWSTYMPTGHLSNGLHNSDHDDDDTAFEHLSPENRMSLEKRHGVVMVRGSCSSVDFRSNR